MRKRLFIIAPFAIAGFALFIALGGGIVMKLWNWLLPALFGWHQISFWQALGLLALCRILFGGFGFHGHKRSNVRSRMAERWARMTPEERERLRQSWRGRCGFGPPSEGEGQV
jgi:hypothetical protein